MVKWHVFHMIIRFTESHDTSLGISFAKVRDKFVFPRESAIYGKCSKFNLFLGLEGELFFLCETHVQFISKILLTLPSQHIQNQNTSCHLHVHATIISPLHITIAPYLDFGFQPCPFTRNSQHSQLACKSGHSLLCSDPSKFCPSNLE